MYLHSESAYNDTSCSDPISFFDVKDGACLINGNDSFAFACSFGDVPQILSYSGTTMCDESPVVIFESSTCSVGGDDDDDDDDGDDDDDDDDAIPNPLTAPPSASTTPYPNATLMNTQYTCTGTSNDDNSTFSSTGYIYYGLFTDASCSTMTAAEGSPVNTCELNDDGTSYMWKLTQDSCEGGYLFEYSDSACAVPTVAVPISSTGITSCQASSGGPYQSLQGYCTTSATIPALFDSYVVQT
jgi:hypothetical protein